MDKCNDCNKYFEKIDTVRCVKCNAILCNDCRDDHVNMHHNTTELTFHVTFQEPVELHQDALDDMHFALAAQLEDRSLPAYITEIKHNGEHQRCVTEITEPKGFNLECFNPETQSEMSRHYSPYEYHVMQVTAEKMLHLGFEVKITLKK